MPASITIPLAIAQAGDQLAQIVATASASPPTSDQAQIFFRVPNTLKTHKIVESDHLKYIREAAFFMNEAIQKKEEIYFLKCIVYQLLAFFFPTNQPMDVMSTLQLMVAVIVELEWAHWAGESSMPSGTDWKLFVRYTRGQWDHYMTPLVHEFKTNEARKRTMRMAARRVQDQAESNAKSSSSSGRTSNAAGMMGKKGSTPKSQIDTAAGSTGTTFTGSGSSSDPYVLWQPI